MPDYRLYFLNVEGHFMRALNVDVADDKAALARARESGHPHGIEIWCGRRMVGIVGPG